MSITGEESFAKVGVGYKFLPLYTSTLVLVRVSQTGKYNHEILHMSVFAPIFKSVASVF